jgi:P2X purinoceptor 4
VGDTEYRMLYKAFGLRFIINVSGTAGKFNILPLMLTIGAGIGLMSISVLIADCVLLHFTKEKKLFQKMKEIDVKESININEVTHIARI